MIIIIKIVNSHRKCVTSISQSEYIYIYIYIYTLYICKHYIHIYIIYIHYIHVYICITMMLMKQDSMR